MANVVNVVRQNLLSINKLKQDSESVDSRLSSLEVQVNSLAELLNSHIATQKVVEAPVEEAPAEEAPAEEAPAEEAPVEEAPAEEAPAAEAPAEEAPAAEAPAEEGNLNLEVQ